MKTGSDLDKLSHYFGFSRAGVVDSFVQKDQEYRSKLIRELKNGIAAATSVAGGIELANVGSRFGIYPRG